MGGNSSKNKGSGAERELCKFLGDLFEGSFVRSNNSGAFVGGRNAFRKDILSKNQLVNVKGDVVPPDHMPRLVIESKFYKEFRFHQLFSPEPCAQLEEWIEQCLDVIDEDDFWVICWKVNLLGWHIAVPEKFGPALIFENHATYTGPQGSFLITDMKSFFVNNKDAVEALSADLG